MTVHFFQPENFLRSSKRTNPYFDPIIKVCKDNDISVKIFMPKIPSDVGYDKSILCETFWLSFIATLFWKIVKVVYWRANPRNIYSLYAKLVRPFIKRKYESDFVISCGGALGYILSDLMPETRIVDIQHGVIYSRHRGYFSGDGRLSKLLQYMPNREFWLFGQGYAECFFKNPENANDLQGRVKVIGDVIKHQRVERDVKNIIVVSGQFKPECSRQCLLDQVESLRKFLKEVDCIFAGRGCKVLIKHHPRFKGIYALDLLYKEFPFFEETKESWEKLYVVMKIHATFSSTVVFDSASNGIVSYLIPPPNEDPVLENWFWRDDYHYPFFGKSLKEVVSLSETVGTEAVVRDWYLKYYEPFSEKKCLQLLTEQRRVS